MAGLRAAAGGGASGGGATGGAAGANQTVASNAPVTANVEKLVQALPSSYHKAAKENFPTILAECQKQGVTDKAQIAFMIRRLLPAAGEVKADAADALAVAITHAHLRRLHRVAA